ncbi:MAG: class I SAM-dependent methyltransferase [Proteobacteria bacterium]|nr:class I SAM-dependent methyltransferase [Pseudomonadota bacterium]
MEFKELDAKIRKYTLVDSGRTKVLYDLLNETRYYPGDVFECGVFKGGTAMMLAKMTSVNKKLYLFDTFGEGLPEVNSKKDNYHKKGDFNGIDFDTIINRVASIQPNCNVQFIPGFIPDTFKGLDQKDIKVSFAHIDVDIYQSVKDCCEFIYPRMTDCGIILFDDYGFATCKGAKLAVDEFFSDKPEKVEVLNTKQAIVRRQKFK